MAGPMIDIKAAKGPRANVEKPMLNQTTSGFNLRIARNSRAGVSSELKRQQRSIVKPSNSCPDLVGKEHQVDVRLFAQRTSKMEPVFVEVAPAGGKASYQTNPEIAGVL